MRHRRRVSACRGLLASPADIARRSTAYWNFSAPEALSQAADRVDGQVGLVSLILGFVIQGSGYVLVDGGVGDGKRSAGAALAAALCAIAAVAAAMLVWRVTRRVRLKALLVEIARHDSIGQRGLPSGFRLHHLGQELGVPLESVDGRPERVEEYLRRVFGVVEIDTTGVFEGLGPRPAGG